MSSLDFIKQFCLEDGNTDDGMWLWMCKPTSKDALEYEEELTVWMTLNKSTIRKPRPKPKPKPKVKPAAAKTKSKSKAAMDVSDEHGDSDGEVEPEDVFFEPGNDREEEHDFGLDHSMLEAIQAKESREYVSAGPRATNDDIPGVEAFGDVTEMRLKASFSAVVAPSHGLGAAAEPTDAARKALLDIWSSIVALSQSAFEFRAEQSTRELGADGKMALIQYNEGCHLWRDADAQPTC